MTTQPAQQSVDLESAASRQVFEELVPNGPRPLIRPASRSVMFGPLAILIAILPGLYGLTHWDLTPPGPWWGLRGLAVLDEGLWVDQTPMAETIAGNIDYNTLRNIALQPPLFAWLEAVLVQISPTRAPLATVLPSYIGGVLLILLIYLQGRTWSKPGTAMVAVWIFAFHIRTLDSMQRAGPATLGAATLVGALQFYSLHIQAGQGGRIRGRILYAMGCGACLGLSLMSVGLIGLSVIPVIAIHQVAINAGESPLERPRHWYEAWRVAPGLFYGATAFAVAMVISAPWHVWMTLVHYGDFWIVLLEPSRNLGPLNRGPVGHLLDAGPVVLFLAVYGAWCGIYSSITGYQESTDYQEHLTRSAWQDQSYQEKSQQDQTGLMLWAIWSIVTLALCVYWPLGPQNTLNLTLAASISLMAGYTIRGLSQRSISAAELVWITPLTILGISWWGSESVRATVRNLQIKGFTNLQPGILIWQIFALIFVLVSLSTCVYLLKKWSEKNDSRTRFILAIFLSLILVFQLALGINELRFRHTITRQLLDLRESIVKRNQSAPIRHIHVVGSISPESLANLRPELLDQSMSMIFPTQVKRKNANGIDPAGRLRFILHSALPRVPQTDHDTIESLFESPKGERLVILVGPDNRLTIADQARLGLEPIHPGVAKIMTAFATSRAARLNAGLSQPVRSANPFTVTAGASSIDLSKSKPSGTLRTPAQLIRNSP